jgi:hypothetical protein
MIIMVISNSKINYKEKEIGGTCSKHGKIRNVYKVLMGKPEGKRLLGTPRHGRKDNIKMDKLPIQRLLETLS